ncbi:hypothetical protein EJB05_17901, partial [Eragrostis curvula]
MSWMSLHLPALCSAVFTMHNVLLAMKYPNGCNPNQAEASDLQSRLREIATWSTQNNAEETDAGELEKLERLLTNALRDTKTKKMLAKNSSCCPGASTSKQNSNGSSSKRQESWCCGQGAWDLSVQELSRSAETACTICSTANKGGLTAGPGQIGAGIIPSI